MNSDTTQKKLVHPEEALRYHAASPAGKIQVVPSKPLSTQYDLSLAYSPGVAEPCLAIANTPDDAYRYTAKGNLVAVVSNGTAVLGLGDIGPLAAKPVMEGKAGLFKKFAGIDVFDLEVDATDPQTFVDTVARLQPTFGGINLEDIKAPECFFIERELRRRCSIPVMHDDQHGTAIITGAALINALLLVDKKIEEISMVVLGAGAAAIACTRFYVTLGVLPRNIVMVDVDGVLREGRVDPDSPQAEFATRRDVRDFDDAIRGADVLLGLSVGNIVSPDHVRSMSRDPVVFALANPDPEIAYEAARAARADAIVATGRSDMPNQVNNVLGFPFIFRGALDVGARDITDGMMIAASLALARLAREPVPDAVLHVYGDDGLRFGRDYLIPKPFDPRLLTSVAPAVAQAAIESGVARYTIDDYGHYETELLERVGVGQRVISGIINRARGSLQRVIFAEADDYSVVKAAEIVVQQGIAAPILLGRLDRIEALIAEHQLAGLDGCPRFDPRSDPGRCARYAQSLYRRRQRKGVTHSDACRMMRDRNYFGAAMVEAGDADAMISGRTKEYPKIVRPALQVIGTELPGGRVAGMYIVQLSGKVLFFADTTVHVEPTVEQLVEIIGMAARTVRFFNVEPVMAVLSHSNFGSARSSEAERMREVVVRATERFPELVIDGEVQANIAFDESLLARNYPFSSLVGKRVNTLIFPNLSAGNIAYKLLGSIANAELIGPILMGLRKPVHVLHLGSTVREIVNMAAFAAMEAAARRL
ncbi:MAG: NADP-dependent malic enzyme [Spirochaetaceae bacterium]|nr:MAG: NADP-dependent malic enzyme [Spirochaetaceae bacterium]